MPNTTKRHATRGRYIPTKKQAFHNMREYQQAGQISAVITNLTYVRKHGIFNHVECQRLDIALRYLNRFRDHREYKRFTEALREAHFGTSK